MDVAPLPRGEWIDTLVGGERLFACADDAAAVEEMDRGADAVCGYGDGDGDEPLVVWLVCLLGCWLVWRVGPCWRKAAMKEERK